MDTGTLELTDEEQQMLRGERGLPLQKAIQYQVEVGSFFGAKRLVPVTNAHFMGDIEVMGDDGLQRLDNLARQGARCAIDTTNNARCRASSSRRACSARQRRSSRWRW